MKNGIKILFIVIALFSFTGCASQSQKYELNYENNMKDLSTDIKVSKAGDDSKTSKKTPVGNSTSVKNNEKKPLDGLTICIDAGHGKTAKSINRKEPIAPGSKIMKAATASGTSGVYTKITEESLNLTVSKKLKKVLLEQGAKVIMVRETSECDLTNVERTKLWNSSGADLTIRLHANGINDSKVSGLLMMIPGDKYIKDKEMLKKSAQAGQNILNEVLKSTKGKSRGTIISTDLTGFNWSKIPVILLEMGFMTNPQEDKLLNSDAYQNKIVLGIVKGLEEYQKKLSQE